MIEFITDNYSANYLNTFQNAIQIKNFSSLKFIQLMAAVVQWFRIGDCGSPEPGSNPGRGPALFLSKRKMQAVQKKGFCYAKTKKVI